ncbi:MAG: hypothetical protein KBB16_02025 [Candidatus Pacebacteria bacterium]|nr:hypothetical protein [Candidatus Paceibacterota bacterium]
MLGKLKRRARNLLKKPPPVSHTPILLEKPEFLTEFISRDDDENIKPGKENATYNVMAAVRQEKRNKS